MLLMHLAAPLQFINREPVQERPLAEKGERPLCVKHVGCVGCIPIVMSSWLT